MSFMNSPAVGFWLKIWGAVLFAVCIGLFVWSLTRPAVTGGPDLPDPYTNQDLNK